METIEVLFAAYVDINILLGTTALVWICVRAAMKHLDLRHAFSTQLMLLKLLFFAALLAPVGLTLFNRFSPLAQQLPGNLSDLVLSQFLQGNLQLNPTVLESVLASRQTFSAQIISPNDPLVLCGVIGALITGLVMLVRCFFSIREIKSVMASAHLWRRFGNLRLMISDTVRVPFSTRTLGRRYVVVPSRMLENRVDMKVALSHELQHLRQRDVDWEIGLSLLLPLFFWNPAYHFLKSQIDELRELSCDQAVLQRGKMTVREYCECLLRVCENRFERRSLFQVQIPEVALIETRSGYFRQSPADLLRNRLMSAADCRINHQPGKKIFVIALCLLTLSGALSFAVQKPSDWSHDRLMLSTIINLDRLEHRNTIGLGSFRNY